MASNKLKVQRFRTNDLNNNGGKQFELGKNWCEEFFEIDSSLSEAIVPLVFKPLCIEHAPFFDKEIELKLSEITNRGDRKAYANGQHGLSQIKNFFIDDLGLTEENNLSDYFAIYKASINRYYLYYIPQILYSNFIKHFESITPDVSIERDSKRAFKDIDDRLSLQQIFYGAPGTGKSHRIKENGNVKKANEKNLVFRTTFHPDSDYSTFVGTYKPTMRPVADKYKAVAGKDEEITYSFVPQAFLQAYVAAWNNQDDSVYLIIEEINRGNCAQIFGDLFQLLDRDCDGLSEYPIMADKDLSQYLKGKDENGQDVLSNKDGIKDGKLRMPKNLYIWATMNTSDQSLFPIDSAFKRRWDWKYIPIDTQKESWCINVNGTSYDWSDFLEKINSKIESATSSEDKMLGFYFCKAENGVISAEKFVNKVLFYLWNDVFKDYGFDDSVFNDENNKKITFRMFYKANGKVDETIAGKFLENLHVSGTSGNHDEDDAEKAAGVSEKQVRFWEGFNKARESHDEYSKIYSEKKPLAQQWMDLSFGSSAYHPALNVLFTKSVVRAQIYISGSDRSLEIFEHFKENESALNEIAGVNLDFKKSDKSYSIVAEKSVNVNNESTWEEAYEWMMSMAIKMKSIKDRFGI